VFAKRGKISATNPVLLTSLRKQFGVQRKEKQVTEDREQTSGEDREQNIDDVEGHGFVGQTTGQAGAGQQITATDDDDPDVEGHTMIGANVEPSDQVIGANTPEPSDQQTGG
jgi:hypothetical protein